MYTYIRPVTVVYVRGMGPYDESSRHAWQSMTTWLDRSQNRKRAKQGFGLFRDNPRTTAPELLRYDACIPAVFGVEADPEAGISQQTLSGGAFAVHTHIGPYDQIGGLISRLHKEIVPMRGLRVDYDRPFMTVFLNDPIVTREVHRRTELCVPVLPVRMAQSSNDDYVEDAIPKRQLAWPLMPDDGKIAS